MRKTISCIIVLSICESISLQVFAQQNAKSAEKIQQVEKKVLEEYMPALPSRQLLSTFEAILISGPIVEDRIGFGVTTHNWSSKQTVRVYQKGATQKDLILQLLWGSVITPPKSA
jgi:hypothetical protein